MKVVKWCKSLSYSGKLVLWCSLCWITYIELKSESDNIKRAKFKDQIFSNLGDSLTLPPLTVGFELVSDYCHNKQEDNDEEVKRETESSGDGDDVDTMEPKTTSLIHQHPGGMNEKLAKT